MKRGDCPDDSTFAELIEHALDADRLGAVEAHLDGCADCRRHLSDLSRSSLGGATRSSAADLTAAEQGTDRGIGPTAAVDPPRVLGGRYEISRSLGRGGMGEVFVARDTELGRRVAVKLLHNHGRGDGAAQARLRREAQAMARLAHPNVVSVFDLGLDGDRVFVAMELVEGHTLATWARVHSVREILLACCDAARGVAAAHRVGLVHRDLTPRNVLVGSDGRARVTDFGLVQISAPDARGDAPAAGAPGDPAAHGAVIDDLAALTRTDEFLGTPAYASPEALGGGPVDERSDQWSLAATAWHAVFDQLPITRASFGELTDAVGRGELDPPPAGRRVPARVRDALRRAMSVDPAARYPSIDALLADLAPRRRRGLAIAAAAVALAAVTGLGAAGYRAVEGSARDRCEPPANRAWTIADRTLVRLQFAASGKPRALDEFAHVERAFDDHVQRGALVWVAACQASRSTAMLALQRRCVDDRLGSLAVLRDELIKPLDDAARDAAVVAAASLPGFDACADVAALAQRAPSADPAIALRETVVRAQIARVRALSALGRYDDAVAQATRVAADAAAPALSAVQADALYALGEAQDGAGDPAAARATLERSGRAAATARDDPAIARAWLTLLRIIGNEENRPQDALTMLPVVTASIERAGDPVLEARFHSVQGLVLLALGRAAEARSHEERAVALLEQRFGPVHLDVAKAQLNLVALLYQLDDFEAARPLNDHAVQTLVTLLGPEHPLVGRALANQGHALSDQRRWPEAEAALARALAIFEAAYAADHVEVAWTQRDIAHMWAVRGEWSKARAYYQRALPVFEHTMPGSGTTAGLYFAIAQTLLEDHRCGEAVPQIERAMELMAKAYGGEHYLLSEPLLGLARCAVERDPRGATALVDRALGLPSVDPIERAERSFSAAKILGETQGGALRARALAAAARAAYGDAAAHRDAIAEIDRWLARRASAAR
jgi:tetratricopeptide (TPR) repeat protein